ncbi:hypothetical protein ABA31_05480 [Agrococcus baldri]|uniref:Uncharacterized protein n=1 Tax=Agrococcus baldri TaxID=153730 RepID=A0AA87RJ81_9MICO|nr:hypothetical protein ABA31_05480 [Agrococcus baldri]
MVGEARATWEQFLGHLNEYSANPADADRQQLMRVADPAVADGQMQVFEQASAAGIHAEGARVTADFTAVQSNDNAQTVSAVVCVDVSGERVIAADGTDVTDADRPSQVAYELMFDRADSEDDSNLLITSYAEATDALAENPCS